jgi:hypothetical protein
MAGNDTEKSNGLSKSFMTVGPTLHYSHSNVMRCWWLAVGVYVLSCLFWSWILSGTLVDIDSSRMISFDARSLGHFVSYPISIYEYPSQILVLGLLMGVLAVAPVLVSQLMSFRYSIPMLLAVSFIARLPVFGLVMVVSCIGVACRPLRFRSRFVSIALCMAPQFLFWVLFGSAKGVDPIKWGFSFAPWMSAWLTSLSIAGVVLGIGHFTRYRPGLVFSTCGLILSAAVVVFFAEISFAELDYQLHVIENNPEEASCFHDRSMTSAIDGAMIDPSTRSYLKGLFYPSEPILLRKDLKSEIQNQLAYDRWPNWFVGVLPEEFKYQARRQWLLDEYDYFIRKWPRSKRTPIASYFKAMLLEYKPDVRQLGQSPQEILHFYSDYPHSEAIVTWYKLYEEFPDSKESLEARWRIAMRLAGQGGFDKAMELCTEARNEVSRILSLIDNTKAQEEGILTAFSPPAKTVMTPFKLRELRNRILELEVRISEQNRTGSEESKRRLARFVLLNPYELDYVSQLDLLLKEMQPTDPLMDNVLLAKVMLVTDFQHKATEMKNLAERFGGTDGGIAAMYQLGLLKVNQWKSIDAKEEKRKFLADARAVLTSFIELYPDSIYGEQARNTLGSLPSVD